MGTTWFTAATVSCRWYRSGRVQSGLRPTSTLAWPGAYVSEFFRTENFVMRLRAEDKGLIGRCLRAEDKEDGLVCAPKSKQDGLMCVCASRNKEEGLVCVPGKQTKWIDVWLRRRWIGMRSRAEEKSMETSLYKTAGAPCGKRGGQRERENLYRRHPLDYSVVNHRKPDERFPILL